MSGKRGIEHALELKRTGRLDEAVIELEGVLAASRSNPVALTHLADVQVKRRKFDDAAAALDRAEAAAGTTSFTARVRGDLRYREGRWREAARAYAEAHALGDKGSWALVQLARCHLRLNDLDSARGAASRALEADEADASAWVVLGEIAARENRADDALSLFERAHESQPSNEYAYAKLVEARVLRLPPEERLREVQVLLRTQKGNRHLLGLLAKVRSEGGQQHEAAETWRARREQHGDLYARKMEGYALRKAGQLDEAASVMRACLLEDPGDLVLFRTFVHLQRSRGALDELRTALEELVPVAGNRRGAVFGELRKLGPR